MLTCLPLFAEVESRATLPGAENWTAKPFEHCALPMLHSPVVFSKCLLVPMDISCACVHLHPLLIPLHPSIPTPPVFNPLSFSLFLMSGCMWTVIVSPVFLNEPQQAVTECVL